MVTAACSGGSAVHYHETKHCLHFLVPGGEGWLVGGQAGISLAFMVWLRSEAA